MQGVALTSVSSDVPLAEELYQFRMWWLSFFGERLSCELGKRILIFGDFGDIPNNNIRERYLQLDIYQHYNADIKNRAFTFDAPWLGDSKSATIIPISYVFNTKTRTRKYTF